MKNKTFRLISLIILIFVSSLLYQKGPISSTAQAASSQATESVSLSGRLTIIWGDRETEATVKYFLTDEQGQTIQLLVDETAAPPGGILALNQKRVSVRGRWAPASGQNQNPRRLEVQAIELDQREDETEEISAADVTGPQPWLSILCKFADIGDTPKSVAYFQGMYGSSYPGLDHYWREVSYNKINLTGSGAVGWYTLPYPRSHYISATGADLGLLFDHCTAAADATVYFPNYIGINLMFNAELDGPAWGGGKYATLDGVTKVWSVTWEPPWGYSNLTVMAHEMGHGFGLPHSGVDGHAYDNSWDIMSEGWDYCHLLSDPTYGCLGQHTIAYHKDKLGWLSAEEKYIPSGGQTTITLERLAWPQSQNYKMVQIPIGGSTTHFYTVEARQRVGYDVKLPGQAVIIHEVDTTRSVPADVIDAGGAANPGEIGAMWTTGETFTDAARGISVAVNSATTSGFVVTITSPSVVPSPPSNLSVSSTTRNSITLSWQDNSNNEDGFKIYRWDGIIGDFVEWADVGPNVTTFTDTSLNCGWEYFYQVSAYRGSFESTRTDWIKGTVDACPTTDAYEPDDSAGQANWIYAGTPQTHNIGPVGDQDWVKFSLSHESEVIIETSGASGDTRLWLYDSTLNQIDFDDDSGDGLFSKIHRVCADAPLSPGIYYIEIDEYGSDNEISGYSVDFTLSVCSSDKVYLPIVIK